MGAGLNHLHPLQNFKTMTQDTQNKFAAILAAAQAKTKKQCEPKKQVKVLGQTVTEGTKLHSKLVQQVQQFNDLAASEANIPAQPELSINCKKLLSHIVVFYWLPVPCLKLVFFFTL